MGIRTVADRLRISYEGARTGIIGYGAVLRPSGHQQQHSYQQHFP